MPDPALDPPATRIDERDHIASIKKGDYLTPAGIRCSGTVTDAVYAWRYRYDDPHPERCNRRAGFMIEGKPLCSLHAGKYLLRLHLGET
jgi:hypothetical protein